MTLETHSPEIQFTIESPAEPGRLDKTLSALLRGQGLEISTRRIRSLCEEGKIRLNGRAARSGDRASAGDLIEIFDGLAPVVLRPDLAAGVQLEVAYEDAELAVVVKPRAVHTVRLRAEDRLTLADMIAARFPDAAEASPDRREGGAVQRLDFFTSGLVIAAKNPGIWSRLHEMLLAGEVSKSYLALAEGQLEGQQRIAVPMSASTDGSKTVPAGAEGGAAGETTLRPVCGVLSRCGRSSIVLAESSITKRHQVRFHLASAGHPLVGDEQYGAKCALSDIPALDGLNAGADGFLLHAQRLEFCHPTSGRRIRVEAPSKFFEGLKNRD